MTLFYLTRKGYMFKNKKLVIKFNSVYPKLINIFPDPEPCSKNIPEWYKKQPGYSNNSKDPVNGVQQLTVKKCTAFFDMLTSGYVLKCPIDIYIDTTKEKPEFQIPPQFMNLRTPMIAHHATEQISHYPIDTTNKIDFLFRINMAWLISTPSGYSTLFLNPQHSDKTPLTAISAIIDTDEFQSDGLFSFVVEKGFKGVIKQGTPLIQAIPYKRENWNSVIDKSFDPVEKLRYQRYKIRSVFNSGYKKHFWKRKEYN